MTAQHTPWELKDFPPPWYITKLTHENYCTIFSEANNMDFIGTNIPTVFGELIVRAINEYDDLKKQNAALLEAAQRAKKLIDPNEGKPQHYAYYKLEKAIAQAEGKS